MIAATPRWRSVRKAPTPIGPAPWMATVCPGLTAQRFTVCQAIASGSMSAPWSAVTPGGSAMGVASLHHRVLGEAAGTVVALDRKRGQWLY